MPKFNKRFIESIQPDSTKTLKFWDSELKGFGVVVLPSGRKTYCIQYRNQERVLKRLKLGVHGVITAEEARELAKKQLGSLAHGKDPSAFKEEVRSSHSMIELANEYMERHAIKKRPKSIYEDKNLLNKIILPSLGRLCVATITRRDLEALHNRLENTPYQANRALALLSKMLSLAVLWGLRHDNPAMGIQKYQEEKRDRWLNKDELGRLWAVLDHYGDRPVSYLFKLLILTGARKGEAINATWDQFDLEKGIWVKPSHLTKQNKRQYLPVSDKALGELQKLRDLGGEMSIYLFPGRDGTQPVREVKKFWSKLLKEASLENVRIHDLRHTHASHLVSSGLSLSIVGELLGHTQAATTQRYAHLADESLREATEAFSKNIS